MTEVLVTVRAAVVSEAGGVLCIQRSPDDRVAVSIEKLFIRSRRSLGEDEVEIEIPDWYAFSRGLRPKRAER